MKQIKTGQHQINAFQHQVSSKGLNASPTKETTLQQFTEPALQKPASPTDINLNKCGGCGDKLMEGQALIALDRQWHIWCFRYALQLVFS